MEMAFPVDVGVDLRSLPVLLESVDPDPVTTVETQAVGRESDLVGQCVAATIDDPSRATFSISIFESGW